MSFVVIKSNKKFKKCHITNLFNILVHAFTSLKFIYNVDVISRSKVIYYQGHISVELINSIILLRLN